MLPQHHCAAFLFIKVICKGYIRYLLCSTFYYKPVSFFFYDIKIPDIGRYASLMGRDIKCNEAVVPIIDFS